MRASTVLSLLVALILAVVAVVGVRSWMRDQQALFIAERSVGSGTEAVLNQVVVAKAPLRFGDRITPDKVELLTWASSTLPTGSYSSIEEVTGTNEDNARFVLSSMEIGEPVLNSRVTSPGQRAKLSTAIEPGMKAVSIRVNDVLGVAGFVLPGDRVDVMLTESKVSQPYTAILLQGVRVLAIDQIADERKDQPSVVRTVTFEVSTEEAQKLTLAATVGTLSLALRNVVSSEVDDLRKVTVAELLSDDTAAASLAEAEAKKLREAEAAALAAAAAAEAAARQSLIDEQTARIAALEDEIRKMGDNVAGRLQSVEENLTQRQEPVVVEKPIVVEKPVVVEKEVVREVIVEKIVEPPPPAFITVGIVRNGQRAEYSVATEE
ncbi:Flp pilus assembly protein CpaB [Thioclava sp. FR2]|uniref:Flp pilus assembly protein CpaB n=1 Tax=Thioclava sp. FR2 TaxID=3445780 RepID=UPI003EC0C98B